MIKHISCDCKCNFNSATCNSHQKWNINTFQCKYKNHRQRKKDYRIIAGIPVHVFVRLASIQKSLVMTQKLCVIKLYLLWILYQQKWHIL